MCDLIGDKPHLEDEIMFLLQIEKESLVEEDRNVGSYNSKRYKGKCPCGVVVFVREEHILLTLS